MEKSVQFRRAPRKLEQARINFETAPVLHGHATVCEALQSLLVPLEHFHTSAELKDFSALAAVPAKTFEL